MHFEKLKVALAVHELVGDPHQTKLEQFDEIVARAESFKDKASPLLLQAARFELTDELADEVEDAPRQPVEALIAWTHIREHVEAEDEDLNVLLAPNCGLALRSLAHEGEYLYEVEECALLGHELRHALNVLGPRTPAKASLQGRVELLETLEDLSELLGRGAAAH